MDGIAFGGTFEPDAATVFTDDVDVRAKWLVIATGAPTWAARLTGEKIIKHDLLTAFWVRIPHQRAERLLFLEPSEFGWWYLCPDDGRGSVACLLTDPRTARTIGASDLSKWKGLFSSTHLSRVPDEISATEMVFAKATGVMSLSKIHGRRWIAVGDAAAKLDPLGSSGIMTSLDGGRRAARAVNSALRGNTVELHNYQKWSSTLIQEFTRQRERQYSLEASRHSTHFWHRGANAPSAPVR
jgi:flavin-dependent dehydrogenase